MEILLVLLQVLTQDLDEAEEQVSTLRNGHARVIGNLQIMQRCHISRMKETFIASLKASPCCWATHNSLTALLLYTRLCGVKHMGWSRCLPSTLPYSRQTMKPSGMREACNGSVLISRGKLRHAYSANESSPCSSDTLSLARVDAGYI